MKTPTKKYVIKMFDDRSAFSRTSTWLRDKGNIVERIEDLEQATRFETKKEAKEVIENLSIEKHCKVVKIEDEMDEFLKWKENGMVTTYYYKIDKKMSRAYNGEGLHEVIEWFIYHNENESKIKYEHYSTWPSFLKCKFTKYIMQLSFYHDEKDYGKRLVTFEIAVPRNNSNYLEFEKEIKEVERHVTFIKDEFLIFSIFDNELCEHEKRHLLYCPKENKCKIIGRYDRELFKGTLEEGFLEILRNYWYDND